MNSSTKKVATAAFASPDIALLPLGALKLNNENNPSVNNNKPIPFKISTI